MEQKRASEISDLFARTWAEWNGQGGTPQEALADHDSVKAGVFGELLDFISEGAVVAVVEKENESPTLYALDGENLHAISVVKPGRSSETAEIENVMRFLDRSVAEVTCRKAFVGNRVSSAQIPRRTWWRLKIGDFILELNIAAHSEAPFPSISSPDELALALAKRLGWKQIP